MRDDAVIEQAKANGYLTAGRDSRLREKWWRWCTLHAHPFVYVRKRRKYATVTLDMLPAEKELSPSAVNALGDIVWTYNDWSNLHGTACYGREGATIPNVRLEDAEAVARALLAIALEAPCEAQGERDRE